MFSSQRKIILVLQYDLMIYKLKLENYEIMMIDIFK